jgi:hypothetical protein
MAAGAVRASGFYVIRLKDIQAAVKRSQPFITGQRVRPDGYRIITLRFLVPSGEILVTGKYKAYEKQIKNSNPLVICKRSFSTLPYAKSCPHVIWTSESSPGLKIPQALDRDSRQRLR